MMSMSEAYKEIILEMLETYKNMPFLWDKKHEDYKCKNIRNEGLRVLLEIFKKMEPNATIQALNKKIHNLRSTYFRELQKVKNSYISDAEEKYVPRIFYYDALRFLGDTGENNQSWYTSRDPLYDTKDTKPVYFSPTSSDEEITSENHSDTSTPQRKKIKIKQESINTKNQETLMSSAGELRQYKEKEEDWIVYGKAIGIQIRDLDKESLAIAQKLISDTIFYAKMGRLSQNSFISLGQPDPFASPSTSSHASGIRHKSSPQEFVECEINEQ